MHAKFWHGTQNFELRGSCTRRTCVPRKKTHALAAPGGLNNRLVRKALPQKHQTLIRRHPLSPHQLQFMRGRVSANQSMNGVLGKEACKHRFHFFIYIVRYDVYYDKLLVHTLGSCTEHVSHLYRQNGHVDTKCY